MSHSAENLPSPSNPLGICGIEFIEFATSQPQALGAVLAQLGFAARARHRSREVMLYQQGDLNIVVNASADSAGQAAPSAPQLTAVALRVHNAASAHAQAISLGAWDIPTRASAMELNIPGIHAAGNSVIYFVDRFAANRQYVQQGANVYSNNHTIYDVDFVTTDAAPSPRLIVEGLHFFGIVQAVQAARSEDWIDFYHHLLGFEVLATERQGGYSGVLPKGVVLQSPCKTFHIQLIEPPEGADDSVWDEGFIRLGLGVPDVLGLCAALTARGIDFVDRGAIKPSDKGAVTHTYLGGLTLELVHAELVQTKIDLAKLGA